jgi:hypothetical protein
LTPIIIEYSDTVILQSDLKWVLMKLFITNTSCGSVGCLELIMSPSDDAISIDYRLKQQSGIISSMPELPEVETVKRGLQGLIIGLSVKSVDS